MFCDSLTTKENKVIQRASLQISDYITTDPQAEVLISDAIDKKYIGCICFQKQPDIDVISVFCGVLTELINFI